MPPSITDYLAQMGGAMSQYGLSAPDHQLACAANFAWAKSIKVLILFP